MHDHSRFQRDINDVTGVSLSLSLLLTKVTDAQYIIIGSAEAKLVCMKNMLFKGLL